MSTFKICNAEKRLLNHLQLGGSVRDDVGQNLVVNFAHVALV